MEDGGDADRLRAMCRHGHIPAALTPGRTPGGKRGEKYMHPGLRRGGGFGSGEIRVLVFDVTYEGFVSPMEYSRGFSWFLDVMYGVT